MCLLLHAEGAAAGCCEITCFNLAGSRMTGTACVTDWSVASRECGLASRCLTKFGVHCCEAKHLTFQKRDCRHASASRNKGCVFWTERPDRPRIAPHLLVPSNSPSGWQRVHCWQKRHSTPFSSASGEAWCAGHTLLRLK